MNTKLLLQACVKFLSGLLMTGLLLFLPAGTMNFPRGWLFTAVLFIPMFIAGIVMWLKAPDLLAKRLNVKEKQGEQKQVIILSLIMFVGGFIVAGLDFRFGWSNVPFWISVVSAVIFLIFYCVLAEVMRENAYLSRTVEVQKGQKVIDTGLYGIVRHPMYFATLFLFLSMPIICGSAYAALIFMAYPFILVKRIKNEEEVLAEELPGYKEYKEKVKYRLIPYVW